MSSQADLEPTLELRQDLNFPFSCHQARSLTFLLVEHIEHMCICRVLHPWASLGELWLTALLVFSCVLSSLGEC